MTIDVAGPLARAPGPDLASHDAVAERAREVLRPAGALERLDEIAAWLAAWQRTERPSVDAPAAVVFVADHGVSVEGVSAYPTSVTAEMLRALRSGVATANAMARRAGVALHVADVGVGEPSGNIRVEPALSTERFTACFEAGRSAVPDCDLLVLGEMGIGNTTPAAAVAATIFGGPASEWTGRGTGIDEDAWIRKVAVVEDARRRGGDADALEVLREVGGPDLVAIAGAIFQARLRSIPVVLDGFVVTAAAAALDATAPGALDHCIAGHRSPEPGHGLLLSKLGKRPVLDLGLRLGEGSGALVAVGVVQLAAAAVTGVATFTEWGLA